MISMLYFFVLYSTCTSLDQFKTLDRNSFIADKAGKSCTLQMATVVQESVTDRHNQVKTNSVSLFMNLFAIMHHVTLPLPGLYRVF